jgi:hypothetical protein
MEGVHRINKKVVHRVNKKEVHQTSKVVHRIKAGIANLMTDQTFSVLSVTDLDILLMSADQTFSVLSVANTGIMQGIAETKEGASKANDRTITIFRGRLPKTTIFFRDTATSVGSTVTTDGIAGKQHLTVEMWRQFQTITLSQRSH